MYERLTRLIQLTTVKHGGYAHPMDTRDPRIPDLVSLREAAALLGITKQAAHLRVQKGQLRGAQIDGAWVFRRTVIEAARDEQA